MSIKVRDRVYSGKFKNPSLIDRIKACKDWISFGYECFINGESVKPAFWFLLQTLKGNFEVDDNSSKNPCTNCLDNNDGRCINENYCKHREEFMGDKNE